MRADRLVATLLLMQTRGRVTAAEIAAELEVSVATARRDLEALSAAGVPVYPQPGRHGGWSLVGGARTDLSGLSAPEARALFLLAGPSAASDEAKAALRKLLRALPAPFRTEAGAAAASTLVDPAGWGEEQRPPSGIVGLLQDAVIGRRRIRFTYRSAGRTTDDRSRREPETDTPGHGTPGHGTPGHGTPGHPTPGHGTPGHPTPGHGAPGHGTPGDEREADPWGLVDKDDVFYLIAGTVKGRRTFRVDRMGEVTVTGKTFERPADFTLDEAWGQVVGRVEDMRARTWATLLIAERFVWVLRDHFGRHCEVRETLPDGRARVRVGAPQARDIARTLSGWGAAVEVLDPPEVRTELARIGTELVELYTSAPPRPSGAT
ncbi:WYL domain-containing protein [Actinoplanes sp. NPDC023801]|uniref:helix-turn-helix transcriptional regulator n=1 Tax=Actinoplanes sp. NPDC023801 TaxID=3154595 RepID=UPI00340DF1DC